MIQWSKPCLYSGTSLTDSTGSCIWSLTLKFQARNSASTYQSRFCRGFPRCHYHLHFCFCRHHRPWVLEMQAAVPIRLGEKGTADGVGTLWEMPAFQPFTPEPALSPSSPGSAWALRGALSCCRPATGGTVYKVTPQKKVFVLMGKKVQGEWGGRLEHDTEHPRSAL